MYLGASLFRKGMALGDADMGIRSITSRVSNVRGIKIPSCLSGPQTNILLCGDFYVFCNLSRIISFQIRNACILTLIAKSGRRTMEAYLNLVCVLGFSFILFLEVHSIVCLRSFLKFFNLDSNAFGVKRARIKLM